MKPLITALVDTYNHERYIEQALVSVLEQGLSSTELEIVVVDDGSTDKTPDIIRRFAPRVKHVRKQNGGQASAFNAGFRESRGEVLATLDGDDWWAEGKLEAVAHALEEHNDLGAVGHGYFEFHEHTQEAKLCAPPGQTILNIETPEGIHAALIGRPYLLPSALTIRRKAMEWIMPIPEEMVFMADAPLQAAAMAHRALVLDKPLSYYRHHAGNLCAGAAGSEVRLRRRCEMGELVGRGLYRMLVERGVAEDAASALAGTHRIDAKRLRLSLIGGGRLETFETETDALRMACRRPGAHHRMFEYLAVAASSLLFPPRTFYRVRDWYARNRPGRHRERLSAAGPQAPTEGDPPRP